MSNDYLKVILGIALLISLLNIITPTYSTSTLNLTPDEYLKIAKVNPELGVPILFPGNLSKIVKVKETREVKEVILTPLQVEEGPTFVRPGEIFMLRVVYKNLDDVPYQIATITEKEVGKSLLDQIWDAIQSFIGGKPKEEVKTYEIVPIYYAVAVVDPQKVGYYYKGNRQVYYFPGGGTETKPGYGCWDIILTDAVGMSQIARAIKEGLSMDKIMCGDVKKEFGIAYIASDFGPVALSLPFQYKIEGKDLGKAIVKEVVVNDTKKEVYIIAGCTDRGDGRAVTTKIPDPNDPTKTITVTIPSRPHDCILNPGETIEFDFWGIVNPLPSGMIPRDVIGDVISALYTDPDKARQYMDKYPGAIHEVYISLGRLNDHKFGITSEDISKTTSSLLIASGTVGGTALLGFLFGGPIGAGAGALVGLAANYFLVKGGFLKLPALQKIWDYYVRKGGVYEVTAIHTMKTYLVIAAPLLQGQIYLVHLGMVVALMIFGGYLGRKLAGG